MSWEQGERSKGHGNRQKEMLQATEHGQEQRHRDKDTKKRDKDILGKVQGK